MKTLTEEEKNAQLIWRIHNRMDILKAEIRMRELDLEFWERILKTLEKEE